MEFCNLYPEIVLTNVMLQVEKFLHCFHLLSFKIGGNLKQQTILKTILLSPHIYLFSSSNIVANNPFSSISQMTEQLANTIIPEDERIFICFDPKKQERNF